MLKNKPAKIAIALCVLLITGTMALLRADVIASVDPNCQFFTIKDSTSSPWRLGGVRFYDRHSYWTYATDGEGNGWTMFHQSSRGRIQLDLFFESTGQSVPAPVGSILVPDSAPVFTRGYNTDTDTVFPDMYVLLRTGGPDVPGDPPDAEGLTLAQLDSIVGLPSTYDPSYRYGLYDSLGVNGGPYSAGFIDTWYDPMNEKAETQVQFPIPGSDFNVNGVAVNFLPAGLDYYWMALAVCQEYFHVDMQWSAAQGAKETGIGTSFFVLPANQKGVYGYWQIASASGCDRALCYPQFFPKFSGKLSVAKDAASSGINADTFLTYYTRGRSNQTPINSALMLNSCLMSMIFMYVNYDICSYATDICWKNSLQSALDKNMGVSFMAVMYNLGAYIQAGKIAAILNPTAYQQTCATPGAGTLTGTGTKNYAPEILSIAQAEAAASRQYEKDGTDLTLVDFRITRQEIMDLYFGDSGTVDKQGNGGLLLHFYDPAASSCAAIRRYLWNTLDSAFNMLAGRAPSASATTISFRYDFLPLVRTVKRFFPFIRHPPNSGDAALSVSSNSGNYSPCSGPAADEAYPYLTMDAQSNANGDFFVVDTVGDSVAVKNVLWTLDNDWKNWNKSSGINIAGVKKKVFGFTITEDQIAFWRDTINDGRSGHSLWIMATDSSGNSCIGKYPMSNLVAVAWHPAKARAAPLEVAANAYGRMRIRLTTAGTMGWTAYDVSGHRVVFEQEKPRAAGTLSVRFPACAHGIYIVQFHCAGKTVQTVRFVR